MTKQVKFSMDEVNKIVGRYVFDNCLLGNVEWLDIYFHYGCNADDSYIVVAER